MTTRIFRCRSAAYCLQSILCINSLCILSQSILCINSFCILSQSILCINSFSFEVQTAEKHIKKTLRGKPKVHGAAKAYTECNSSGKKRKFVHANFHNSKNRMQKSYSEVGTKLDCNGKTGTEVWASSIFQGAGTQSKSNKKQKLFLKAHTDTHSLQPCFYRFQKVIRGCTTRRKARMVKL